VGSEILLVADARNAHVVVLVVCESVVSVWTGARGGARVSVVRD